jgi:hypothetical protein
MVSCMLIQLLNIYQIVKRISEKIQYFFIFYGLILFYQFFFNKMSRNDPDLAGSVINFSSGSERNTIYRPSTVQKILQSDSFSGDSNTI